MMTIPSVIIIFIILISCSHPATKRADFYKDVLGPASSLEKPCVRIEHYDRRL